MNGFSFPLFYDSWLDNLHRLLRQLSTTTSPPQTADQSHELLLLIDKFVSLYDDYYRAKSLAADKDPLFVLVAPWATALERSLHWVAGWRPTTAFHVVYTESSALFESHIIDILRGLRNGDLGDLSPTQFRRISELQCDTVKEENAITEELAVWQESWCALVVSSPEVNAEVDEKIRQLQVILKKADDLRVRTIRTVVDMLTPQQSVEFLIAATELLFGIRGWGLDHDYPSN